MARANLKVREWGGARTQVWQVDDRTTTSATATIKPGEPVKLTGVGSPFAMLVADGDPEIGTDIFLGVAMTESTETSTVDGEVEVLMPVPGQTVFEIKATTVANIDTEAELNALIGDCVALDLATGTFTVDENEGDDDNVHGFRIIGGDFRKQTLYITLKTGVSQEGSLL